MNVVVIGAGIAGLGAAHYFRQKGHQVQVVEASDRAGGRAISYQRPGTNDIVDVGTQYYHSSYKRALRFINQAGMESQLRKIRGYTRIYDDNLKKGSFLFNRYLPWYQSTGVFGNLNIGYHLAKTFIKYEMDPFALDYYALMDDVDAVENNTSQVIYKSIIQPLTQVGALSEPDAMKVSQHHIHRLVHIILMTEYLSLSRGTASLHQAMSDQLPVKFESPVISIIEEGGQVVGVQLENEVVKGDHFVVATTPPAALKFIPEHGNEAHEFPCWCSDSGIYFTHLLSGQAPGTGSLVLPVPSTGWHHQLSHRCRAEKYRYGPLRKVYHPALGMLSTICKVN